MKFHKITVKNFKPWMEETEIKLYSQSTSENPITANVGMNHAGKTSICDAVLWTIYGAEESLQWDQWVNIPAQEIAKTKNDATVPISTKLDLEIEGQHFQIVRSAQYNINTNVPEDVTVSVIDNNGNPIGDNDASQDWIDDKFPEQYISKYYIFSAEQMLNDFTTKGNDEVKKHVNVITGITALSKIKDSIGKAIEKYDDEKANVHRSTSGFNKSEYDELIKQINLKTEAITGENGLDKEIEKLNAEKKLLFPTGPSQQEVQIKEWLGELDKLENQREKLEENFSQESNPSSFLPKAHFIFLKEIIEKCTEKTQEQPVSKGDWDSATAIISSAINNKFSGILIESNNIELIDRTASIPAGVRKKDTELQLANVSSNLSDDMRLFLTENNQTSTHIQNLSTSITDFLAKRNRQIEIRSDLRSLGASVSDRTIEDNIKKFLRKEQEITEKNLVKKQIEGQKEIFVGKRIAMEGESALDDAKKKEIARIDKKIKQVRAVRDLFEKTEKTFSGELITKVTDQASKIFLGVIKDSKVRYKGLKITDDYEIQILDLHGKPMSKTNQVNAADLELAYFSFLLSLPAYVKADIPYFIDNPFMRLDTGNEQRLLKQLVTLNQQIIMNLIPGREYNPNSYKWLGKRLNTQNWLKAEQTTSTSRMEHTVQNHPTNKVIEYRDEDL